MKSFRLVATTLLAACFLLTLLAAPAFAAAAKKPTPPPDRRYLVKAIDKANNTISIYSSIENTTHKYRVDDMTAVQVDGATAKFDAIKVGMEVSSFTERDTDDLDNVSLLSTTSAPVAVDPTKPQYTGSVNKIESVLPDKNSVVIFTALTKTPHTYHVDIATTLQINGINGKFEDIKPGMVVKDYVERDNDDLDSLTLTGGYDDDSTPTPPKKKK
jgi:hypothetical protein